MSRHDRQHIGKSRNPLRSGPSDEPAAEQPAAAGADRQAGQEADRIDATLRNNEEGFGKKATGESSARDTAREVARKQGQSDR